MAKQLKKIFDPSVDQVDQTYTINAWHVSQSVDALTGIDDYDITISGSLTVTGSVSHDLIPNASGIAASVLVRDNATGEYKITGSYSVDYVSNVNLNGTDLEFTGVGDAFTGSVALSSLVDYVNTVSLNGTDLEFTGVGDAFTGSVDLSSLVGSTDYVENVTLNTNIDGTADLLFTGVGDAFNGTASLDGLRDNQGGFTFRYSGSTVVGVPSWPYRVSGSGPAGAGEPNKVVSTTAPHLTASGVWEWHFSDINREFSSQYQNTGNNIFNLITSSVLDDNQILVRVYDDKNPRYEAFYTNIGPADIGNINQGGDLILSMSWVGGTGFGAVGSIAFGFPNGTNPNNTNVSFEIVGSGGSGSVDTGSLLTTSSISDATITFTKGNGSTFDIEVNNVTSSISSSYATTASYAPNFYNEDGTITDIDRNVTFGQINQTLNFIQDSGSRYSITTVNGGGNASSFRVSGDGITILNTEAVVMDNLPPVSQSQVIGIDSSGNLSVMNTSSFGGGGSVDTGSLLTTSSISDATITFTKGNGSTFDIEVNNVTSSISSSYATTASYGPNIYNTNGNLLGNRTLDFATNNLTFDVLQGETFQTTLDSAATHSIQVAEGMIQIVPGIGFAEVSSSYLLTYDSSDGRVQYMSTASFGGSGSVDYIYSASFNSTSSEFVFFASGSAFDGRVNLSSLVGGSTSPGSPLNSFQFNSASIFEGSALYYDSSSERVGLGIDSPARPFHISSSNAVPIRLESTTASAQGIQFFGSQASTNGVIVGSTGNNDYRVIQGLTSNVNLYISSSGNTYLPNIVSSSQVNIVGYDSTSGELTYFDTGSLGGGTTIYTGDGTITGNRLITFGSSGYFQITGSVSNFEVHSNEILFPLITQANTDLDLVLWNSSNGRLFYTSSAAYKASGSDGQVQFNDNGNFGAESNFTWDKTNNYLTLRGNANAPAIKLENSTPGTGLGVELAELVARSVIYGTDLAGIIFKGDGTFSGGNNPSRIEFTTTPTGSNSPTTKMTIKENGRVGIGVVSPTNGFLEVNGNVSGTSIYASANIVAYSDARSKTNVTTIDNALDKVDAIRGVTYNKVDDPDGIRYMGVIAQELQDVLPEVVAEGEDGNLAVAYGNIVGVLIEAIKELRAEIKELKEGK